MVDEHEHHQDDQEAAQPQAEPAAAGIATTPSSEEESGSEPSIQDDPPQVDEHDPVGTTDPGTPQDEQAETEPEIETEPAEAGPAETDAESEIETEPAEAGPAETDAEPEAPAAEAAPEAAASESEPQAVEGAPEPEAAPTRAPRRARRSASRPAGPPAHVEPVEQAADSAPTSEATAEAAGPTGVEAVQPAAAEHSARADDAALGSDADSPVPPARRHRRATRGVTSVAFSATAQEEPVPVIAAAGVPALALFQPADETVAPRKRKRSSTKKKTATESPAAESADATAEQGDATTIADDSAEIGTPVAADITGEAEVTAAEAAEDAEGLADESSADADESSADADESSADDETGPRRRRRRGGRRRRRPNGAPDAESDDSPSDDDADDANTTTAEDADADSDEDADGESAASEGNGSKRRRRRRRRAGVSEEMEDLSSDDVTTVVKVRDGRRTSTPTDEITAVRGSARIEAKKQRRRDGREAGRRRAPILTEAEFLARREAVDRVMCVRETGGRTQIAVLEDGILAEHYVSRQQAASIVGNVYLGRVQNVLPSMEAAFVDIGRGRNAVLYAGEVNWDAAGLDGQPKRIEFALKSGDPVLVQVTKEPIGHKGARLTSQISLPGRFVVYVPEGSMTGISRKLPDTERARLKAVLKEVVPPGAGVIVRTAAEGATEEQLTADVQRLTAQWAEISKKSGTASPPTLLYGEPDLAIKVARDIFNEDFKELIVQGDGTYSALHDYVGWVAPDLLGKLSKWVEPTDLYKAHRIDEQLAKALDRKVWLPSGGSLVIDRTEAMTVVDVNTGKFTGQGGNLEETVTKNNLEAAEEIVRQLRLRDIGGIIVVDFIDMVLESNRDLVLRRLLECLGRDRTRHQVAEVTSLGLVQMTRKRIGQGLLEVFSTPCEHCGGRGHLVHTEPIGVDPQVDEPNVRGGRDRGRSRAGRPAAANAPVHLGGRQTGKTPPPPKFDEFGHIDHSEDGAHEAAHDESESPQAADEPTPIEIEGDLEPAERDYDAAPEAPPAEQAADHPEHLDREAV